MSPIDPAPRALDAGLDEAVRRAEPDLWLASRLVADPARRAALIALYALHAELGKVSAAAVNPLAGEIRLAWWREEVEALSPSGRALGHPALQALRSAHGLDPAALHAMIEARHAELDARPFKDEAQLLAHLDGVYGGLMRAAASLLGGETSVAEAARAYGWSRLLLDRPAWAARGREWTPVAWGEASDADILAHVQHRVADALLAARVETSALSIEAFPAVVPATLARLYARGGRPSPLEKRLRLLRASLSGRI